MKLFLQISKLRVLFLGKVNFGPPTTNTLVHLFDTFWQSVCPSIYVGVSSSSPERRVSRTVVTCKGSRYIPMASGHSKGRFLLLLCRFLQLFEIAVFEIRCRTAIGQIDNFSRLRLGYRDKFFRRGFNEQQVIKRCRLVYDFVVELGRGQYVIG